MGNKTKLSLVEKMLIGAIVALVLINLLAVFSPELGFDALWYHLTLAKLFLWQHRWFFPGGLLYYSAMPRLGETLFIPLLQLFGITGPKLLQFIAGLVSTFITYRLGQLFFSRNKSILAATLFYATWLVSWQSGSAYVDLIRTTFEIGAVYLLLKNEQTIKTNSKYFFRLSVNRIIIFAGVLLGLAVGTKLHALASLLLAMVLFNGSIVVPAIFVALPWFIIATHFTGHPLYPLNEPFMKATQLAQVPADFLTLGAILRRFLLLPLEIAKPIDDLLNPVLGLLIPLGGIMAWKTKDRVVRKMVLYGLGGLLVWQLIPPPSARYLLPYLPILVVIAIYSLELKQIQRPLLFVISLSVFVIILGRGWSNRKFVPYLLGRENQTQFLIDNANRLPSTFVDSDGWVAQNLPKDKKILVDNLHNLYYMPVNFDHVSWQDPNYHYSYLITFGADPSQKGELLHTNSLGIQIFKL